MLRNTSFLNSIPMMSGPQVGNSLDPQEWFNKEIKTMAASKPKVDKQ